MNFSKTLNTINELELEEEARLSLLESVKEDMDEEEKRNNNNLPSVSELADEINIRK